MDPKKIAKQNESTDVVQDDEVIVSDVESQSDEDSLIALEIAKMMGEEESSKESTEDEETEEEAEQAGSEASGTSESESEEGETQEEEIKPLDERLAEIEKRLGDTPEEEIDLSAKGRLSRATKQLEQLENQIRSKPFPYEIPRGGIFAKDGVSVFEMSDKQLNDYLVELKDAGHELQAAHVQTTYINLSNAAKQWKQEVSGLEQQYLNLRQEAENIRHESEWQDIRSEVGAQLPEITEEDYLKIGSYIDSFLPLSEVATKEQKAKAAILAASKLGILARLKSQTKPQETKPSAPDARVVSKKVKSTPSTGKPSYSASQLMNMKQADFNKLPEDVVDMLLRGEGITEG